MVLITLHNSPESFSSLYCSIKIVGSDVFTSKEREEDPCPMQHFFAVFFVHFNNYNNKLEMVKLFEGCDLSN